jgi:hypothetical protein
MKTNPLVYSFLLLLFTACSPEDDPTAQNTDGCPVATFRYQEDDLYATDHFEYQNGNISKIRKTGGYSAQTTTTINYDDAGNIISIDDGLERLDVSMQNDEKGQPYLITVITSSSSYRYTTHYLYEYDANGYITRKIEFFDHPSAFQTLYKGNMNDFQATISAMFMAYLQDPVQLGRINAGLKEMSSMRYVYDLPNKTVRAYQTPMGATREEFTYTYLHDGKKNPLDTPNLRQYALLKRTMIYKEMGNLLEVQYSNSSNPTVYKYEYSQGGYPLQVYTGRGSSIDKEEPWHTWTYACR